MTARLPCRPVRQCRHRPLHVLRGAPSVHAPASPPSILPTTMPRHKNVRQRSRGGCVWLHRHPSRLQDRHANALRVPAMTRCQWYVCLDCCLQSNRQRCRPANTFASAATGHSMCSTARRPYVRPPRHRRYCRPRCRPTF